MNTLIEDGVSEWLADVFQDSGRTEPVLAGEDDRAVPDESDGSFVRCVCEVDEHEVGPLWLAEFRIEICTPMHTDKTIEDHRELASLVAEVFGDDDNLVDLDTAMQAAAGRTITGWYRLDQHRESQAPRRTGWWTEAPVWRIGMQEME